MCIPIKHGQSGVKRNLFRLVTNLVYNKLLFDNPLNFDHNNAS